MIYGLFSFWLFKYRIQIETIEMSGILRRLHDNTSSCISPRSTQTQDKLSRFLAYRLYWA